MSKEIKEEKLDYDIIENKLINKLNNKDFNTNNSKEKNSIKDSKLLQNRTKSNLSSRQYSNSNVIPKNRIEKPTKIKSSNLIALGYSKRQKSKKEDYFKLKTLTKISKNKKFNENSKNFYFNVNDMTENTTSFYRNINAINNNIYTDMKFPDLINGSQKNKNRKNMFTPEYLHSSPTRDEIIKRSKSYLSDKDNRDIYNNEVNSYFSPRMFSYIKKPEQKFKKMVSIGKISTNMCVSPSTTNNSIINNNNSSSNCMNKNSFTSNMQKSKDNNITVYIENKVKKMTAIEYQLNQLLAKKEQKEKEKEKDKVKYKIDKFNNLIEFENNTFNLDDLYLNYLKHTDDNSYRDYAFQEDNYSLRKNDNSKTNYAKLSNNYNYKDNFTSSNEIFNNHDTTYGDSSYRLWLSKNFDYKNNNTDNSKIVPTPKIRYSFLDKAINKINRKVSVIKPHSEKQMELNMNKNSKNKNQKDFITYGYELTPEILFKIKQLHKKENMTLKEDVKRPEIKRPNSTFSISGKKYKKNYEESKNIDKEKNNSISKNYMTKVENTSPIQEFLECLGESSSRNKLDWNLISEADKEQGRILWKKLTMMPKTVKPSGKNINSKTSKKELKNIISNIQKNSQNNIYKVINNIKEDRTNVESKFIKNKYSNNINKNDKSTNAHNIDMKNNFTKSKNINILSNKNIIGLKKETKDYKIYNTREKKDSEIEKLEKNNKKYNTLIDSKLKEKTKMLNQNQNNFFKIEKQKGILSISNLSNMTIEENKEEKKDENETINDIEIGIEETNSIKKEEEKESTKEKENFKEIKDIKEVKEIKDVLEVKGKIDQKNLENIKEKENDIIKEKEEEKDKKLKYESHIKIKNEINIFINRTISKKPTKRQSISKNKINTQNAINLKRDSFSFSPSQKKNKAKSRFRNQYKNQDIIDLLNSENTSSKGSKNKSNKSKSKKYNSKYLFHKKRKKIYNLKKKEKLRNEKYQKKNPNIIVRKNQSFILEDNRILNKLIPKEFKDNNISKYINDEIDYWSDDNSKRCDKFKQQVLVLKYFPKRGYHPLLFENLFKKYKTKQHNDEEKMNKYYDEIYNKYENGSKRKEELINISIYGLELKITKKMQKNYYKRFMENVKESNKIQRDQKRNNRRLTLILDKYNLNEITEECQNHNLSKSKRKNMVNKDKIKHLSILKTDPTAGDDDSESNGDKELLAWKERINTLKKIEKKNLEALLKLKNDIKFKIREGKINDAEMEKYIQFQKRINDLTLSGINNGFHMGLVEEGFDSFEDELRMNEEKRKDERRINSFIDSMTYDLNYHFKKIQKENLLHVIDFKIKNFVNVLSPIKINPRTKSRKKINKFQKKKQEL